MRGCALPVILSIGLLSPAVAVPREGAAAEAYRTGSDLLRARSLDRAVAALERAAELAPNDADCWAKLGLARAGLERWDDAISAFERALAIDPRYAKAQNNLANVHFRRGDFSRAAEAYTKALEIDPGYILALYHLGWVQRQLDRPEEAALSFDRCLKAEARSDSDRRVQLDCLFYAAALRYRAGDYLNAAALMERVLAANPAHREARYYLGMAYRRLGRIEDARRQLEIHQELLRAQRREEPVQRLDDP